MLVFLFKRLEKTPISPVAGLISLVSIVLIRYQLEMIFESRFAMAMHPDFNTSLVDLIHVLISWSTVYGLFVTGLALIGGKRWSYANRMALFALPLIWLPPIVDALAGTAGDIAYQYEFTHFVASFINLFNPTYATSYVTVGVRIEILCVVLFTALYIGCSNINLKFLRAFLTALWCYCWIFVLGFLPAIWNFLTGYQDSILIQASQLNIQDVQTTLIWYLPFILILFPYWFSNSAPMMWRIAIDCVRPARLMIYLCIFGWGFIAVSRTSLVQIELMTVYDYSILIYMALSIGCLFVSLTALNDICDIEIDLISNSNRLLASGSAKLHDYNYTVVVFTALSFLFALSVDSLILIPVSCIFSLGFVYSSEPLRLRRFIGIAHLTLLSIALLVYLVGGMLVHQNLVLNYVSSSELVPLALLFFMASHFKDIKDADSDSQFGVVTLATLFGKSRAYLICGLLMIFGLLSLVYFGYLICSWGIWSALIIFAVSWWVVRDAEKMFMVILVCLLLVVLAQS